MGKEDDARLPHHRGIVIHLACHQHRMADLVDRHRHGGSFGIAILQLQTMAKESVMKQAKIMMYVCAALGVLSLIFTIVCIADKSWVALMGIYCCFVAYISFKGWQAKIR